MVLRARGRSQTIIANLRAARLTILYAQSGVGKSSLLRAGVARELGRLAQRQLAQRGRARYVPVVFSDWKDDPVDDLIGAIQGALAPYLGGRPAPSSHATGSTRRSRRPARPPEAGC